MMNLWTRCFRPSHSPVAELELMRFCERPSGRVKVLIEFSPAVSKHFAIAHSQPRTSERNISNSWPLCGSSVLPERDKRRTCRSSHVVSERDYCTRARSYAYHLRSERL